MPQPPDSHDGASAESGGASERLVEHVARRLYAGAFAWEALPEATREQARLAAREVLQALADLGYRIEPPPHEDPNERAAEDTTPPGLPRERDALDLEDVSDLWRVARADPGALTPETYRDFGEWLLRLGAPLMAYDVIAEGLDRWPDDVRLRQLLGLALARSGATERANALLRALRDEGHADEETLGMLARTHKDLWQQATDPAERDRQLRLAHEGYERAYRETGGYWTGINAATMALVRGQCDRAHELAREVREQCEREIEQAEGEDLYWPLATLGEAALILGDSEEACRWYARAAEAGAGRLGDLSTTRRNARLILEHVACDAQAVERCLCIPNVVAFAGHMIDQPDREPPRFPPDLADDVYAQILERLERLECRVSFGSAACGADILFSEAMLELNGEAHVVLPYPRDQFVADSVDIAGGNWPDRFDRVLEEATSVITASSSRVTSGSVSYHYADLLVYGLAEMRARELQTGLIPMAVWDGGPGDGSGGTESIVQHWQQLGHEVKVIDTRELLQRRHPEVTAGGEINASGPAWPSQEVSHRVMAVLFADLDDFHRLTETQIDVFVREFLGGIADIVNAIAPEPAMRNTWGDAIFLVFATVGQAGRFALELDRFVSRTDWAAKGLPGDLKFRVGLHAGPVHPCVGPLTGTPDCFGTHVTRAARIVEITPPGQVYASQAFAALACAEGVSDLGFEYVGVQELPNEGGTCPTYHVRTG